jgi:hypothetical protein
MSYPPYGYPPAPGYPGVPSYFFIRSRLSGLVLDVEGNNRSPGARILTWHQKPGDNDNQLWYEDYQTGTIRSKLNGYCFDLAGDTLVLNPFYPGNTNQQWMKADPFIQNRVTPHRVLDVADNNSGQGARIIAYNRHGGTNQMFDFQYFGAPSYPPAVVYPPAFVPGRRFFIVSELHGKVLDIEGANRAPGAHVIVWPRKHDCHNQLWYLDGQNVIRSSLNDFALDAQTDGQHVRMAPFTGKSSQRWMISGNRIVRDHKNCLDIEGGNFGDGAKIIQWNYKGSSNQHWRIEYV